MIEVIIEVDGRPLSRWGCDGVVCATPTGSTAYGFSAGGPVVWPEVEALLMVPISAHALFARPLVVSPNSVLAVELVYEGVAAHADAGRLSAESAGHEPAWAETSEAVMWCDGRRRFDLPPGARVEVRRGSLPVLLARVHGPGPGGTAGRVPARRSPTGWWPSSGCPSRAGGVGRRLLAVMLEEVRITGLGVIDDALLELSPVSPR